MRSNRLRRMKSPIKRGSGTKADFTMSVFVENGLVEVPKPNPGPIRIAVHLKPALAPAAEGRSELRIGFELGHRFRKRTCRRRDQKSRIRFLQFRGKVDFRRG